VSHVIWRIRTQQIRKDAAARGKTFDDIAAEYEARGEKFQFAERKSKRITRGDAEMQESSGE
jgi:hypothetical protein